MIVLPLVKRLLLCLALLAPPGPALAQDVWSVSDQQLRLHVGEAKFIRLPAQARAVYLSNPAVAEVDLQSTNYVYIVGQQIGDSTLFILGDDDTELMSAKLQVNVDVKSLTRAANRAVPGNSITVASAEGAIFLSGTVRNDEDADRAQGVVQALVGEHNIVVNGLALAALPQINLQVRIAEVSRTISEDLGISLTASSSTAARRVNSTAGGFNINVSSGTRNINLVLDALARNGLVSILSEPNLTARSGENATFLAGGRIPYAQRDSNGEVSYTMEPIGVELEFTPHVRDRGQIEIGITTRVRDVDAVNSTNPDAPSLTERSATTTVELGSGQSFAIAGMFRANSAQSISGMPGLSKVPVIGALFSSSRFAKGETELVIIVTPYLVKPGSPADFTTPVDRLRPVSGATEQALSGQLQRNGSSGASRLRRGGFVLD